MESKKVRNIKVISQSGRNYKPTPTVILKGQWLNEMGFEIGDQIKVECENGKLVISLDRENDLRVRLLMACLCAVGGFYFFVENCMKI